MIDLKDFNDTGFVVIKNWLDNTEVKKFIADFNREPLNPLTGLIGPSQEILDEFEPRMLEVCRQVNQVTGQNIDVINPAQLDSIYWQSDRINFRWHQDHTSTYLLQDLSNYMQFYFFLEKDFENFSGISVVPNNVLKEKLTQEQANFIWNRPGAKRFLTITDNIPDPEDLYSNCERTHGYDGNVPEGHTVVCNDVTNEKMLIPVDLNDIKVNVPASVGDLTLIKGSTIHESQQERKGNRLSLTVRCMDSRQVLQRSFSESINADFKKHFYDNMPGWSQMLELFDASFENNEERTVGEIFAAFKRIVSGRNIEKTM